MDHTDHVDLIRAGVPGPGGVWADFGSGEGAFTLALAELLGPQAEIYSVDRDRRALQKQADWMKARFPGRPPQATHYLQADFTSPIELPPLDGLVMANSLHFHKRKEPVVELLMGYLRPGGRFILVEYNADRGNLWVPHPLSYPTWESLAARCGLVQTRKLAAVPSRFLGEIYSALSFRSASSAAPS